MIGETLDRKYKLLRLLGEGGMGSVYEAEQQGTLRRVAVKTISSRRLLLGGDGVERFRREAQAASAIHSEHIAQVLDSGTDEASGLLYLVMDYLQGEDLQQLIQRCGPLPVDAALRIAAQALLGLQKAHEAHLVHRDIKPSNLFLSRRPDGAITVKLLDFGIARFKAAPGRQDHTTSLTSESGRRGSPLYMSPEQVLDSRHVDRRTDIWSLGSVLYCALAGHAPFGDIETVGRLIIAICATPPPPLREIAPSVPPEVAALVHDALKLTPNARHPSAAAMLEKLRPLLSGGLDLREEMLVPADGRPGVGFMPEGAAGVPRAEQLVVGGKRSDDDAAAAAATRDAAVAPSDTDGGHGAAHSAMADAARWVALRRWRTAGLIAGVALLLVGLVAAGVLPWR